MLFGVFSGIISTTTGPAAAPVPMANFTVMQLEDSHYSDCLATNSIPVQHCSAIIQMRSQDNSRVHKWPAIWGCSSYGTVGIAQSLRTNDRRPICFKLLGYASAAELSLGHLRMACALQKTYCWAFPASLVQLLFIRRQ
jgi:hypothetical protein